MRGRVVIFFSSTYHRNGSFGAGYHSIEFRFRSEGKTVKGLAIVFDASEHIAILNAEDFTQSYQYEDFCDELRGYLKNQEKLRSEQPVELVEEQ